MQQPSVPVPRAPADVVVLQSGQTTINFDLSPYLRQAGRAAGRALTPRVVGLALGLGLAAGVGTGIAHAAPLTIQPGDTLFDISIEHYGSPQLVETIAKANNIQNPDLIYAGDTLELPEASQVVPESAQQAVEQAQAVDKTVTIQAGDTLFDLSQLIYETPAYAGALAHYNDIADPNRIFVGQQIQVPTLDVIKEHVAAAPSIPAPPPPEPAAPAPAPAPPPAPQPQASAAGFIWPTQGRTVNGGEFGAWRGGTGVYQYHTGLDIANQQGTPIVAAATGIVTHAGWGEGAYGISVVINHGNGYQTRYAHMSGVNVSVGQTVGAGQQIGAMGATGWATGSHLHFEVIKNGEFQNPIYFLP